MQHIFLEKFLDQRGEAQGGDSCWNGVCGSDGGVGTEVGFLIWRGARRLCNRMDVAWEIPTAMFIMTMGYYVCSLPSKDSEKITEMERTRPNCDKTLTIWESG